MRPDAVGIGWIGTGVMGRELLGRILAAGHAVKVFNRTRSKAEALVPATAIADSPREVAAGCEVIFLSLVGAEAIEWALFDPTVGVCAARRSITIIDTSTVGPNVATAIYPRLQTFGIEYLESPVSGGPEGARRGTLTAVLSGSEAVAERFRPLISHFAKTIHYVGGPGKAQTLKVLNNQAEGINMIAAAEVIALGLRAGIDLHSMKTVLSDLRGYSRYMDVLFDRLLQQSDETSTSLEVRVRDMRLALDLARRHGSPLEVSELAEKFFAKALDTFGADKDQSKCFDIMDPNAKGDSSE